MKKFLALLLAVLMTVSLFVGCGSNEEPKTTSGNASVAEVPQEDVDPLAPMAEPVTLTTFFEISGAIASEFSVEQLESMYYTQKQREATNVTLKYEWYAADSADDSDQKKNAAIATGDIPDFMVVDSSQLALLAKTDLIRKDMDTLFDTYASDLLKEWTYAEGTTAFDSATFKGNVVAIPLVTSSIDNSDFLWLRQDWLDKLGLEVPTTMEELYDVLIAFRDQDPDGNGVDDTTGIVMHKTFLSSGIGGAAGLFNGFNAAPLAWTEDGNGGLVYGAVTDESKEALSYLHKMFEEGLIQEDFATMDDLKASELAVGSKCGAMYGRSWVSVWPLDSTSANDPDARWVATPIVGANGQTAHPQVSLALYGYVVINAECEHPEAVIKLLNFWVETQGNSTTEVYQSYMYEDPDGLMMTPQHWTMLKCDSPTRVLDDWYNLCEALEKDDQSILFPSAATYWPEVKAYIDGDSSASGSYGMMGPEDSAYAAMAYYYENDMFVFDEFTGSPTATMGSKRSIVNDKVYEYYTKVIMGTASLDDWDSFVDELNNLGLADITTEVNEWYASR